jgi:hypothetical protein
VEVTKVLTFIGLGLAVGQIWMHFTIRRFEKELSERENEEV